MRLTGLQTTHQQRLSAIDTRRALSVTVSVSMTLKVTLTVIVTVMETVTVLCW